MAPFQRAFVINDDDDEVELLDPSTPQHRNSHAAVKSSQYSSSSQSRNGSSKGSTLRCSLERLSLEPLSFSTPRRRQQNTPNSSGKKRRREETDLGASPSRRERRAGPVIDLTEDEIIDLVEKEDQEAAQKLEEEEAILYRLAAKSPKCPPRNLPPVPPFTEIKSYRWNNSTIMVGKSVELHNGTFLRITGLIENLETGAINLRGWLMKRAEELGAQLGLNRNELFIQFDVELEDPRAPIDQCVIEIELADIVKLRQVVFTNKPYPEYNNFEMLRDIRRTEGYNASYIRECEILVVRYKFVSIFENAQQRREIEKPPGKWSWGIVGKQLQVLNKEECSPGKSTPVAELRFNFRGETALLGSFSLPSTSDVVPGNLPNVGKTFDYVDLCEEDSKSKKPVKLQRQSSQPQREEEISQLRHAFLSDFKKLKQKSEAARGVIQCYTFGDGFCGAGGMSRGAYNAGLWNVWGVDFSSDAGATFQRNFPYTNFHKMWAHHFISLLDANGNFVVDILHLSPPCQFFSPVHTRIGQDDEQNTAALFAVAEFLDKAKPRIVTLEETPGLLTIHKDYFNALIGMFTEKGFSISWQIVKMENYGLPQKRHRLVVVASCPGEPLPSIPPITHSEGRQGGLKSLVTPREVLRRIHRNAANHQVPTSKQYSSWDDNTLINTITCGTTLPHPSGKRACTDRERAALNGYPDEHIFWGRGIRRQIGNSVPPVFGKILLQNISEHLEKKDHIELSEQKKKEIAERP